MTDPRALAIEVLAEALLDTSPHPEGARAEDFEGKAAVLLANPRLASLMLTGAAVEMLEVATADDEWTQLTLDRQDVPASPWLIFGGGDDDSTDKPAWSGWGSTIPEAITKALEAKP